MIDNFLSKYEKMNAKLIWYRNLGKTFLLCCLITACSKPEIKWNTVKTTSTKVKPTLKVYLDNSGSMDGYMCDGSELKDDVYSYVSALNGYVDTTELHYINSQIVCCKKSMQDFVRNLTPAILHSTVGNTAHSEISDMLEMILNNSKQNTVSMFVSDCIIDVPQGNAQKFLGLRKTDITNAFTAYQSKDKDVGVEVMRMESNFDGLFYRTTGALKINKIRPYYIIMIGNKQLLAELNKKVPLTKFQHEVKDYCAFTSTGNLPFDITNSFGNTSAQNILSLKSARGGEYEYKANVDLSTTLQINNTLVKLESYRIDNPSIVVSAVSNAERPYTHSITFNLTKEFKPSLVNVYVKKDNPIWLEKANKETTGIKYIVEGISDAFRDDNTGTFNYTILIR